MKRIVLAIIFLVLASVGCMQPALPTLTPAPSQTPALLPTLTPSKTVTPVSTQTPLTCLVVTADSLTVRMGATIHSQSIDFLRNGQRVYALESVGNWWQLAEGYIHSAYVEDCDALQSQTISKRR